MSSYVRISCDRDVRFGRCPAGVYVFGVDTVEQARAVLTRYGWSRGPAGDRCPGCSGSRRDCPAILRVGSPEGPARQG